MSELPSFQGGRLKQAREVRQITATVLAERVGMSVGAISSWEKGRAQPRSSARRKIAEILELPEEFFLRKLSPTAPKNFRFRSQSSATMRARRAAHGRAHWLHEIVEFLNEEVEIPSVDLPEVELPPSPQSITSQDIEDAANATRRMWGLREGPILHLVKLLESRGIIIARLALNAAKLDGLSGFSTEGRPYIVLNSEKASCVRSRFDAAHELGHLILHRNAPLRPEPASYKLMENQAHHFAGAFLFPRNAVFDEVAHADLDSLVRNKERWLISIGATIYRLYQLGIILDSQKSRLWRQMGSRGWRSWEPLDDELRVERPTLLQLAYRLLCEEGGWSPLDITRSIPLADHDHELLAGLPSKWMKDGQQGFGKLVQLRKGEKNSAPKPVASDSKGKVINFPGSGYHNKGA